MDLDTVDVVGLKKLVNSSIKDISGHDFITNPDDLADPHFAVFSACEEWKVLGLNSLADADDFRQITKRINGGLIGLPSRLVYYAKAKRTFGVVR